VLVNVLGLLASKVNNDCLGRTLDALYPHVKAIWGDISGRHLGTKLSQLLCNRLASISPSSSVM
jgi:hypothetical protein